VIAKHRGHNADTLLVKGASPKVRINPVSLVNQLVYQRTASEVWVPRRIADSPTRHDSNRGS
jgi:hypothetical protein